MQDELITPDNVSRESLKAIFDAAFMDSDFDSKGHLKVREELSCRVLPNSEKSLITLLSVFGFVPESNLVERLEAVDNINKKYLIVRASTGSEDSLQFSYDIPLEGGITKKALVLTVKRFCSIPRTAVQQCCPDIVE